MFVGRNNELNSLNKSYRKNTFQFPVIYGRRRVGKTTLINEFCKGKKSIYFVAVQSTLKENLEILSAQILSALAPNAPKTSFLSFREAIEYVFERASKERFVFAIDEFPYLANSDMSVSSVLQAAIDKYQEDSRLFIILCGSSMSFMETQVLGYESPLYGRRTAQYKILPFDYFDSAEMLPGFSDEEKIILYSITGGTPEYLARIDNGVSVQENIEALFFTTSGRLFEEPPNLLKQELKMPETYNAIIAGLAGGNRKLNEIATRAGIETSQCSKMLSTLIGLGLVRKEYPVTEPLSKKSLYSLDDLMFVFWYRFVQPEYSRIAAGMGKIVCDEVFTERLNAHIGFAFEECAKQYLWRALAKKKMPVSYKEIGRWWGNNPKERREEEIDILAFSGAKALFGECKWRNTQTDSGVLADLARKAELSPKFVEQHYILFSKSGFTGELKSRAKKQRDIILIEPADMFAI